MTIVIDTEIIELFKIQWWHLQYSLVLKCLTCTFSEGFSQISRKKTFSQCSNREHGIFKERP